MDMDSLDRDATYADRSRALDLGTVDWCSVRDHRMPREALRTLHYMQDIETHTLVYLRELLATRAIDEPGVGDFLACWIYEESAHGRAIRRFLEASGEIVTPRERSRTTASERLREWVMARLSRSWPDFVAVHMTWGAINERTTLAGYNRLAALAGHPVLSDLLTRIGRDESRHFGFYFRQARRWLARPRVAPIVRFLVRHFWAPVGSGVQPSAETRFLGQYLFAGPEGRAAARGVDRTIHALPGLAGLPLLEHWLDRAGI
jgi:hypothetical protein